jgi:hypothetical protein
MAVRRPHPHGLAAAEGRRAVTAGQVGLFVVAAAGIWVFWRRERVDPVLVGFLSCVAWFSPGLVGVAGTGEIRQEIVPGTYAVMAVVVVVVALAGLVPIRSVHQVGRGKSFVPHVLLVITICAAAASIATVGRWYLHDKELMLPHIGRWHYLAAYAAPLCLAAAVAERVWWVVAAAFVVLLADLYIGFRGGMMMVIIATGLLLAQRVRDWRSGLLLVVALLVSISALLLSKQLAYKAGTLWMIAPTAPITAREIVQARRDRLEHVTAPLRQAHTYTRAISESEPFVIAANLNKVVSEEFMVPLRTIGHQALTALPFALTVFRIAPPQYFGAVAQPALFPDAVAGMASNPWAQAYAAGGFPMVAVFAIGYALGLLGLSWLWANTAGSLQGIIAVLTGWWAFYIHRNDLMTEIGILKFSLYVAAAAIVATWVWKWLASR